MSNSPVVIMQVVCTVALIFIITVNTNLGGSHIIEKVNEHTVEVCTK